MIGRVHLARGYVPCWSLADVALETRPATSMVKVELLQKVIIGNSVEVTLQKLEHLISK